MKPYPVMQSPLLQLLKLAAVAVAIVRCHPSFRSVAAFRPRMWHSVPHVTTARIRRPPPSIVTTREDQREVVTARRPTFPWTVPLSSSKSVLRSTPGGFIIDVDGDDDDSSDDGDVVEQVIFVVLGDASDEGVADALLEEDDEDEEDDEEGQLEEDPYIQVASSEFQDDKNGSTNRGSALTTAGSNDSLVTTKLDWGGALSKLRERVEDVESGKSQDPSQVLFRMMSSQTPNQIIGQFVSSANPQVVQAMSGAITSLLGGLSNPNMGVETLVKASGEKIGSLCFQLQMTGYMFRNAEYVLALKDLMNLKGRRLTLDDYKDAFDRLDKDESGYIEVTEVPELFKDVYEEGKVPSVEVTAFLEFFDKNKDGKISWDEFEQGLGAAIATAQSQKGDVASRLLGKPDYYTPDDEEDDDVIDVDTNVSGTIQIEMEDGKIVDVDAKEYMENLKEEARKLKEALRREHLGPADHERGKFDPAGLLPNSANRGADIAGYIAARQGDVKSLTEGISPEVVETMKKLVDFVLEGGDSGKAKKNLTDKEKAEMEMEIPGSALQQLALWQLVLGYRLREEEAKGDYVKLLKG